jgi:hypothetical protein
MFKISFIYFENLRISWLWSLYRSFSSWASDDLCVVSLNDLNTGVGDNRSLLIDLELNAYDIRFNKIK